MSVSEFESFVGKFHQLWRAGITAHHLDMETHAGQAWVALRVPLGQFPGPVPQDHHQQFPNHSQRSPAYFRRQEKRKETRAAADMIAEKVDVAGKATINEEVTVAEEELNLAEEIIVSEKAEEIAIDDEADKVTGNTSNEEVTKNAEQAEEDFSCELCDFRSNWNNGISHSHDKNA